MAEGEIMKALKLFTLIAIVVVAQGCSTKGDYNTEIELEESEISYMCTGPEMEVTD